MRDKRWKRKKIVSKNYQRIAEERAQKSYVNCTVLNSYYVGEDGGSFWYEVILVDRAHPAIIADPRINWICGKKERAVRGLTAAGRRSRAL